MSWLGGSQKSPKKYSPILGKLPVYLSLQKCYSSIVTCVYTIKFTCMSKNLMFCHNLYGLLDLLP
jgi:hypothetical protein